MYEQNECNNMTEMTIIGALEKLASLNKNGMQTLVQDDGDTLTTIDCVIFEIHDLEDVEAEITGSDKELATSDYFIDSNGIRENNKDGRLIYRVVETQSEKISLLLNYVCDIKFKAPSSSNLLTTLAG
jgi:hypothetical protein